MVEYRFRCVDQIRTHPIVRRIWLFTLAVGAVILMFMFLPWQQTVKGTATLMAYDPSERVQTVSATINGFVSGFHVGENDEVTAGAKLFTMVDLDADYAARVEAMERQLRDQLLNTRRETASVEANRDNAVRQRTIGITLFAQRRAQAEDTLARLRLRRVAALKQYETEQANLERIRALYEAAIESRRRFERADAAFVAARTALENNDVDIEMQQRSLRMIEQERAQFISETENRIRTLENGVLAAQNRYSALQRDLQRQLTEMARFATADVRAEKNGTVVRILTNDKNKFIRQGEPVLQFTPVVRERAFLLKLSDFNMPLIHAGLKVRLLFYGWPALQISGWPMIRFGTFGGIIKKVDPVSYEQGFYYAYVVEDPDEPWPDERTLRRGTQATGWVALETVPVWYQLWRLMNAMPPKMVVMEGEGL